MVPPKFQQEIWDATKRFGTPNEWGLTTEHSAMMLEPYTYSSKLIEEECFKLINAIAEATDVTRLFPAGSPPPHLDDKPPKDSPEYSGILGKRIEMLG